LEVKPLMLHSKNLSSYKESEIVDPKKGRKTEDDEENLDEPPSATTSVMLRKKQLELSSAKR
jgi:hypothetical protein